MVRRRWSPRGVVGPTLVGLRFLIEQGPAQATLTDARLAVFISSVGLEELLSPLGFYS
jgi:hypothetical protein